MEKNENFGILDVMAADEIHDYFKAKRAVNDDKELCDLIKNYEEKANQLTAFLDAEKNNGYDPAYALELANQVDLLAGYLEGNPKINALKLAYDVMNRYLESIRGKVKDEGEAVAAVSCDGICTHCTSGTCSPADLITKE